MKDITIHIDDNDIKALKTFLEKCTIDNLEGVEKTIYGILQNIHYSLTDINEKPYRIIKLRENIIAVKINYAEWLIEKFKFMGGKWDKQEKVWKFKNVFTNEIEKLLDSYYDKVVVELEFNENIKIKGENYFFFDMPILKNFRDEYNRIETIKLANDVTLIDGKLPKYVGQRKGGGYLVFQEQCVIRAEIPRFLFNSKDLNFEYGSFRTID